MGTYLFRLNNETYEPADYVKSDSEIDVETLAKIRERYSEAEELKLHRQKLAGEIDEAFETYNTYVNECREAGQLIKMTNAERLENTIEEHIPNDNGNINTILLVVE